MNRMDSHGLGQRTRLLHARFDAQASATPDREALYEGERSITFSALKSRSQAVSALLRSESIRAGDLVGLHLSRSSDWVAAALGILRLGAAVLPLPPDYPEARLSKIAQAAGLGLVLGTPEVPAWVHGSARYLGLPDESARSTLPGPSAPTEPMDPASLAFVLCSSGSTGVPKLIARSHRSFFHRLEWTWARHPFTSADLGCQKSHMTTTHMVYELFEPLLCGAPAVLIPDLEVRQLERFWDVVRHRGVTRLLVVPSMLQAAFARRDFRVPDVDVLVLMGEYVPPALARELLTRISATTSVYSIYGSTEASSTMICDLRVSSREGGELPLGRPISDEIWTLVLDGDGPAEPGAIGRLLIAGPALFDGYLGDRGRTEAAFREISGIRYYDTRDDVRLDEEGQLFFVGRTDQTVKIRGYRIDLPEVEAAMLDHPLVREAAVVPHRTNHGSAGLIGFYSPDTIEPRGIHETMRSMLPEHMIPGVLVGRRDLPRTPSGKVDRRALLEGLRDDAGPDQPRGRWKTDSEADVADAFAVTLGHRRFRRGTSFFEAGGSSLAVFGLAAELRDRFELSKNGFTEEWIYSTPTVEGLAGRIDDLREGASTRREASTSPTRITVLRDGPPGREPIFCIASAGGTLGAYERFARVLEVERAVVGVGDPLIWGRRDPLESFDAWVGRYLRVIVEHQPRGPYYLCAYSSAGAFGLEIAQRLRGRGEEVATVVLIDPLAISFGLRPGFGYWALRASWMSRPARTLVRLAGWARLPLARAVARRRGAGGSDLAEPPGGLENVSDIVRDRAHLMRVAAVMELNSGLPFLLSDADFEGVAPERRLAVLQARVDEVMPQIDADMLERIVIQYEMQVRAQHRYRIRPYPGRALVVEPSTPHAGLVSLLLRPYLPDLVSRVLPLGPSVGVRSEVAGHFGTLDGHYRSMRDDQFVRGLAEEVRNHLTV